MKLIKTTIGGYINPNCITELYVAKISPKSAEVNVGLVNGSYYVLKTVSSDDDSSTHFDAENEARIWLDNFVDEL